MRVLVDADACPGAVKEIVVRAAERLAVRAVFVANKDLRPAAGAGGGSAARAGGPDASPRSTCSEGPFGQTARA